MRTRLGLIVGGLALLGAVSLSAGGAFAGFGLNPGTQSAACTQLQANFQRDRNLINYSKTLTQAQKDARLAALAKAEAAADKANNCNYCLW